MKISYCLIFSLLIMVLGCKKVQPLCCGLAPGNHIETAQRNGMIYETPDIHGTLSTDSILITSAGQVSIPDTAITLDSLSVNIKYTGPGTYKLLPGQVYYFIRYTHIVPYAPNTPVTTYLPDPAFNSSLTISSYDQSTTIMTGTFNLKFLNPKSNTDISILSGVFMFPVVK